MVHSLLVIVGILKKVKDVHDVERKDFLKNNRCRLLGIRYRYRFRYRYKVMVMMVMMVINTIRETISPLRKIKERM